MTQQWASKLLVVGQGGVGKTSLLKRLLGQHFDPNEDTTHGLRVTALRFPHPTLDGITITLNAWDFGGQEIYHVTHQFFLTNRSLFLLVWSARHEWEQGRLYYWLDTIRNLAPESPVVLAATHVDERDATLPFVDLCRKYPNIVGSFSVSCKSGLGIQDLKDQIVHSAAKLPLMGEPWPPDWASASEAIRFCPEKYISPERLRAILATHRVCGKDADTLTQWLHELGGLLYFSLVGEICG